MWPDEQHQKKAKLKNNFNRSKETMQIWLSTLAFVGLVGTMVVINWAENDRVRAILEMSEQEKADKTPHSQYYCDEYGREVKDPSKNPLAVPCNKFVPKL